jgi:LysR family glycine cleavage system transcriptional activator
LGVALAHDTVASHLIETGQLVRPFSLSLPMKEAYYLIAPEGTGTSAAAQAFTSWLLQEVRHPNARPLLPAEVGPAPNSAP